MEPHRANGQPGAMQKGQVQDLSIGTGNTGGFLELDQASLDSDGHGFGAVASLQFAEN